MFHLAEKGGRKYEVLEFTSEVSAKAVYNFKI